MSPSSRPTYTASQIQQFYDRINLPQHLRLEPSPSTTAFVRGDNNNDDGHRQQKTDENDKSADPAALVWLRTLLTYAFAHIPFENLSLHYSAHRTININPHALFTKIVGDGSNTGSRGRGGYCMENNTLLFTVLKTLGFDVYPVGARVCVASANTSADDEDHDDEGRNQNGENQNKAQDVAYSYTGWSHMLNIVRIGSQRYFVDIGFGGGGPARPMPLIHDHPVVNVAPQMARVRWGTIDDCTSSRSANGPGQELWIFEKRDAETKPWVPVYCFTETEFLPKDFEVMNLSTSTSKSSWFTYQIVCVLYLMDEEKKEIVGNVTLFNDVVKKRIGANSEVVMQCKSEKDRVHALDKYFNVGLSPAETTGIKDTVAMIREST